MLGNPAAVFGSGLLVMLADAFSPGCLRHIMFWRSWPVQAVLSGVAVVLPAMAILHASPTSHGSTGIRKHWSRSGSDPLPDLGRGSAHGSTSFLLRVPVRRCCYRSPERMLLWLVVCCQTVYFRLSGSHNKAEAASGLNNCCAVLSQPTHRSSTPGDAQNRDLWSHHRCLGTWRCRLRPSVFHRQCFGASR